MIEIMDLQEWLPQYNFQVIGNTLNYDDCCVFLIRFIDNKYNILWRVQDESLINFICGNEEHAKEFIIECMEEYQEIVEGEDE